MEYDDKNWGKSSTHPSPYLYGRLATDMRTRRAHISNLQSCKSRGEAAASVRTIAKPLEPWGEALQGVLPALTSVRRIGPGLRSLRLMLRWAKGSMCQGASLNCRYWLLPGGERSVRRLLPQK